MVSTAPRSRFFRPIFWAAGLILFVAAFFLPAVRMPPSTGPSAWGPGTRSTDFLGWECAEITPIFTVRLLQFVIEPQRRPQDARVWPELPLLAISGWVNPLLLFYLLSCVVRKLLRYRRFLAGLIVLALIATWIEANMQLNVENRRFHSLRTGRSRSMSVIGILQQGSGITM